MRGYTIIAIVIVSIIIGYFIYYRIENYSNSSDYIDNNNYGVMEIDNFLTDEECDAIIKLAVPQLHDSKVYSSNDDNLDKNSRTSKQCWLRDETNHIVNKISQKTVEITGVPLENQEDLQVVRYESNGFYNAHYDACDGSEEFCQRMNEKGGPRIATLLVYLNDNYEGGETEFPLIKKKVIPKKGKAVLFYDVDSNTEKIIKQSFHAGVPVKNGEKWICNKWVRLQKFKN